MLADARAERRAWENAVRLMRRGPLSFFLMGADAEAATAFGASRGEPRGVVYTEYVFSSWPEEVAAHAPESAGEVLRHYGFFGYCAEGALFALAGYFGARRRRYAAPTARE